jgi:hypothetical protein
MGSAYHSEIRLNRGCVTSEITHPHCITTGEPREEQGSPFSDFCRTLMLQRP